MNLKIKHLILAVFSLVFISAYVLYIPSPANSKDEVERVKFGFPLAFIEQDMTCMESFAFYPNYFRFSPKQYEECPVKNFSPLGLIVSLAIAFLALEAVIYILEIFNFYIRKIFSKNKKKEIPDDI